MIVEARGVNTYNKGAELMLRAIVERVGRHHDVALEPRGASYKERQQLGLLIKVEHHRVPERLVSALTQVVPANRRGRWLDRYGLALPASVDATLDASGFAYSDQFSLVRSQIAAAKTTAARVAGKPVVLLPQAFGPFTSQPHREAFLQIVASSDLVYAREEASLHYALDAGVAPDRIRLAPDFTCLVDGVRPEGIELPSNLALVVPSAKLLTETRDEVKTAYLPFMANAVRALRAAGSDVRFLVHESGDRSTIARVQDLLDERIPVLERSNAKELKGIIGAAKIVVGSRFHALVSALSQGVPAVGVGWSHKYEMLFRDYGSQEQVVAPTISERELVDHLDRLLGSGRQEVVSKLHAAADAERGKAEAMWRDVERVLEPRV